uniref:GH18 domain-containing protein n=2 Tax=Timema TaxID=61471 RepID=A0A7R9CJ66_TIMPO|nr:unnamed protein product [Timema poppensis]
MRLWICFMTVSSIIAVAKAQGKTTTFQIKLSSNFRRQVEWCATSPAGLSPGLETTSTGLRILTHPSALTSSTPFADLASDGTIQVGDPSTDSSSGLDGYNRLNRLKQQNPNLKTLIAVGGGSAGSAIFSQVFNSAALRAAFVDSAANFVQQNGFNGLDVDWEFPGDGTGSQTSDKVAFADTLVDLRTRFNPLGLILTVACPSPSYYIRVSYDITRIAQSVDFINLMTYDFHNGYQSTTGLNAPLYVRQADPDKELNVYAGVENWLNNGAPAEKIVLGMGFYGTAFILADSSNNGVGAPAIGAGGSGGTLMYNQICQSQMVNDGWNINWDDEADVPFANRGTLWVGYDDPDSIAEKAQYALDKGLGGAMVWSIDMDDFRGICGDKNVLLWKIKDIIG